MTTTVATIVALTLLTGCSTAPGWSEMRADPSPVGSPGAGFFPATPPPPESTHTPPPGSWDGVGAPEGYRVVLLTVGDDAPTAVLVRAVQEWATETRADLEVVHADDDMIDGICFLSQKTADSCFELGHIERLGEIIVRIIFETIDNVFGLIKSGKN